MTQNEQIQLISGITIIVFLILGLVSRKQPNNTPILRYSLYWIGIFLIGLIIYSYKDLLGEPINRLISTVSPSTPLEGNRTIIVRKSRDGHFYVNTQINDRNIKFLIDTGATEVLLSKSDAIKAGINIADLSFDTSSYTASGTTKIARTTVDIRIGAFEVQNFNVYVNSSENDNSLLGMSLLDLMESMKFEGDQLILEY